MEITATIIKIISVLFQYGMLFFLLYFIYKVVRYMREDSRSIIENVYAETEITNDEAILSVLESGDPNLLGRRFAFSHILTVGRGEENDIILQDNFVSHNHAKIEMLNNQYVIEDLGSINHTFVNGVELHGPQYLQSGDVISIGTLTMRFER